MSGLAPDATPLEHRAPGPAKWYAPIVARAGCPSTRLASAKYAQWVFRRRFVARVLLHLAVFSASYFTAFLLRFEFALPDSMRVLSVRTLPWVLAVKLAVFYYFGSLHARWRFVTFSDLSMLLQASACSTGIIFAIDLLLIRGYQVPRVVVLIDWGVTVIAVGGIRSTTRILREHMWPAVTAKRQRPVLVIGAEKGGELLVRHTHAQPELNYRVVGFLDNNRAYYGSRLGGIPFLGSPEDAVTIAREKEVSEVFVITGSLSGHSLRSLLTACRRADIRVKMIPPLDKLLDGSYQVKVRDVDINDLLRRDPIQLDAAAIARMLKGRRVMVTGAGGSIGSELCRQIARHQPQRLILIERAENNLFQIEQELGRDYRSVACYACVADVCDEGRLHVVFQRHRPQVVFHTAAHKHVPLMECNAGEAIKNNVFGTRKIADLSHRYGVDRFILISTDKVVNPASVMGMSKKLCERYVRSLADMSPTRFVAVRFGNVLGSNGSVVPTFQEQIRRGGPITVTHQEMRRFFMSIPEASQLVLQAAVLGNGGEIFVLDMGEPIRIVDLAKDLIRLSGLAEDEIETTFVGIRPGEKLYEELHDADEQTFPTSHPKLRVVMAPLVDHSDVLRCLAELEPLVNGPEAMLRDKLHQFVGSKPPLVAIGEGVAIGDPSPIASVHRRPGTTPAYSLSHTSMVEATKVRPK